MVFPLKHAAIYVRQHFDGNKVLNMIMRSVDNFQYKAILPQIAFTVFQI